MDSPQIQYSTWRTDKPKVPGFSHELISTQFDLIKDQTDLDTLEVYPFEGIDTLLKAFFRLNSQIPDAPLFGTQVKEPEPHYEFLTVRQSLERAEQISHGYRVLGLIPEVEGEEGGEKMRFMGIQSKNRVEWALCHIANMFQKTTTVALYDTLGHQAIKYIVGQTLLSTVSLSLDSLKKLIEHKLSDPEQMATLKNIVVFENEIPEDCSKLAEQAGITLYTLDDVITKGKEAMAIGDKQMITPKKDDVYMLSYTSGTTGNPKGVKLTHNMMMGEVATGIHRFNIKFDNDQVYFSFLPFSHIIEQMSLANVLNYGIQMGFFTGNLLKLMDDIKILKPTFMICVPRILNKIYDKIKMGFRSVEEGPGKEYLDLAINTKLANMKAGKGLIHEEYDVKVFAPFKAMMGGRFKLMLTGSAPIAADVLNFLKICFCAPIAEGYGMTETAGAITNVLPWDTMVGNVGGPFANIKIRLRDIPEMGYLSSSDEPKGELCFFGQCITKGYYKNPEKTAEAMTEDGWLRSGDVGQILPNGAIKIIDRAKNIFKLSQGEYIAPEKLENVYVQSKYVAQNFIYGDSLKDFLIAFVVIEPTSTEAFCKENGCEFNDELLINEEFKKLVIKDYMRLANENQFNSLEKPKQYWLVKDLWTPENDLLTPTMKLKRNAVKKLYEENIKELYEAGPIYFPK